MLPSISVVVPSFNAEATLARTLTSLAIQEYPNLEVILIDGGSRDRTIEICRNFPQVLTRIVSEPDNGQSHALNKGFALASGEIRGWLCADDELTAGALHEVARLACENADAGIFVGVSRRVFPDGSSHEYKPAVNAFELMGVRNTIDQPATYWRREYHERAVGLDESMHYAMDWDWWNRLRLAGARPAYTDRILANYYFSANNKTSSAPEGNLRETYLVVKRHGPLGGALADIFMYLFREFDMTGCYDQPPTAATETTNRFHATLRTLTSIFGEELIHSYNWNWISKQLRGIVWYQ